MRSNSRLAALLTTAALLAPACRQRDTREDSAPAATVAAPEAERKRPRLPEDPVLGAKSSAQWEEHLEEEEEHRRLCYDRDRLAQHEAVLATLTSLRQRHERARSAAEVAAARAHAAKQAAELRKRLEELDPWKNSSLVVADLEAIAGLLVDAYPSELAKAGGAGAPGSVAAELDRRTQSIRSTLERAKECEDE